MSAGAPHEEGVVGDEPAPIREASLEDLPLVLRHRRGMFFEMGYRDQTQLDAMEAASAPFFEQGLRDGTYVGFFALDEQGRVMAGGGWRCSPTSPIRGARAHGDPSW